jgi:hypothetical protein
MVRTIPFLFWHSFKLNWKRQEYSDRGQCTPSRGSSLIWVGWMDGWMDRGRTELAGGLDSGDLEQWAAS